MSDGGRRVIQCAPTASPSPEEFVMRPQTHRPRVRRLLVTMVAAMLIFAVVTPITFASSTAIPGFGLLEVRTEPTVAATIAIDGEVRNTGHLRQLLLPMGEYEVSFGQVDGFLTPPVVTATVRDGDVTEIVGRFVPGGLVDIRIDPPDLEPLVTVDGQVRDRGAVTVPMAEGSTEICALAVDGYETPPCVTAEVKAGEVVPVTLALRAGAAPVEESSPAGAAFASLLSEDELAMQRNRRINGPFRVSGDFSANSPGHWNEMASAMSRDFSSARWSGPTRFGGDGRVLHLNDGGGYSNDPPWQVRQMAHDMMSAAYAAAITNNHAVAAAITREIEWQATRPNLDYSNRTRWPFNYYNDLNPLFMHAVWVKDYVLAYDVTRAMGHSSPIVERWFLDLAELQEQALHANLRSVFPNRKSDSYANRASWVNQQAGQTARFANGTPVAPKPRIMGWYNNRRSQQAGFYGLVGVVLDNTYYKEEFKRYAREWVMFGHRVTESDGFFGDHMRGNDRFPQLGFSYALHALESLVPAMDGLARQGDTSLYEFSSSEGAATGTGGTNHYKTMEGVLGTYIRWIEGSNPAQYTGSGLLPVSAAGDPHYRIQSRSTQTNREIVNDAMLLLPANYYNRTDWHDAIMRVGTPSGFTATPNVVGSISGWRTDWRHRFLRSLDTNPYPTRR